MSKSSYRTQMEWSKREAELMAEIERVEIMVEEFKSQSTFFDPIPDEEKTREQTKNEPCLETDSN